MSRPQLIARMPATLVALGLLLAACSSESGGESAGDPETTKATTSPSQEPDYRFMPVDEDVPLEPGRWAITAPGPVGPPLAAVEVPAGFFGADEFIHGGPEPRGIVAYWPTGSVHVNPCARTGSVTSSGSVRDITRALVAQELTSATKPVPVTLDGYDGEYLELTLPKDLDYRTCKQESLALWEGPAPFSGFPGMLRLWIVDVDGDPVALSALTEPPADDETVQTLMAIAESVEFVQP